MNLQELLSLDWDDRILAEYERLKQEYGDREAETYLRISQKINIAGDRKFRELEIVLDPFFEQRSRRNPVRGTKLTGYALRTRGMQGGEYRKAIEDGILQILHPRQLPMRWINVEHEFFLSGFFVDPSTFQKICGRMVEDERLRRLPNPYRGRTYVYCHPEFQELVQVGDRVVQLTNRKSSRIGTVTRFKTHIQHRRKYPVVLWEHNVKTGKPLSIPFESFAHPSELVILERPQIDSIQRVSA